MSSQVRKKPEKNWNEENNTAGQAPVFWDRFFPSLATD
jgi:hypothetical protein